MSQHYAPAISACTEALDAVSRCYDHIKGVAANASAESRPPAFEEGEFSPESFETAATTCRECVVALRSTLDALQTGIHTGLAACAEECRDCAAELSKHELDPKCYLAAEACRSAEKACRNAAN